MWIVCTCVQRISRDVYDKAYEQHTAAFNLQEVEKLGNTCRSAGREQQVSGNHCVYRARCNLYLIYLRFGVCDLLAVTVYTMQVELALPTKHSLMLLIPVIAEWEARQIVMSQ